MSNGWYKQHRVVILTMISLFLWTTPGESAKRYVPLSPDPMQEPWRIQVFPELNDTALWSLAEGKDGNMWFGTTEGVRRYDGMAWTTYTSEDGLYGSQVNTLCVTRNGDMYAGTNMGMSLFRQGAWQRVFPPEGDLPWPIYDLLEASDGSIWAGSFLGALQMKGSKFSLHAPEKVCRVLDHTAHWLQTEVVPAAVAPNRPWSLGIGVVITHKEQLASHPGRVPREIWAVIDGSPAAAAGLQVGDCILAYDIVARDVKLIVQKKDQVKPFELTIKQKQGYFPDFKVWDVYEDRDGAMWFGLYDGEIASRDTTHT